MGPKKIKLTAGKMLRWRAVGERVEQLDAAKQSAVALLQRVKYHQRRGVASSKRDRSGCIGKCGGGSSSRTSGKQAKETSRECGCPVAQYIEEMSGLCM